MVLEFGEYMIRELVAADATAIARHADNPGIARVLRDLFPSPYSLPDAEEFIAKFSTAEPRTVFAIATKEEAVGVIGFFPGEDVYRFSAEIGYWIGQDHWGRDVMTRAVEIFTEYVFNNFKINRLYAGVFSSNPASGRVLEKAGYTCEGTHRCHVYKNGEILDEHLYGRVRPGLVDK
ncbi:MAG: GNAT family protein [Candidatus Krumholzibacteriota bacterium]